jgi:tRNA(fMet)-specific endonuclease VapC
VRPSFCLDTNIPLILVRGKALAKRIDEQFGLSIAPFQHTISIVTHGELYALSDRLGWGAAKVVVLQRALREFVTVDVAGKRIVEAYRDIERFNAAVPVGAVKMGKNDIWIAATAIVTGQALITTDKDFLHLNGKLLQVFWVDQTMP